MALRVLLSLMLALSTIIVVPGTALAFDGPSQDAYNASTATGSSDDPYAILVTKIGDPEQTRPSAFWSGTGTNTASGGDAFVPFAVTFEQREGNTTDGSLVSSMSFDMHDDSGRHNGAAAVGPVLAGGADGTGADVWSGLGQSTQSSWVYAFRLAPYSAQDTSTGNVRIGFAWHGCFATYFDTWEYAFDAVSASAGLAEDKQIKAGDTITMTYYGGYDVGQTSRGTGYGVDFSNTSTVNTSSSALSVLGDPTMAVYEAVVGDDGFARFSGSNSIQFGGNYTVAIKERAAAAHPDYVGNQGTPGTLTVSGFNKITTDEGTTSNYIQDSVNASSPLTFNVSLGGAGTKWDSSRYPGGVEGWLNGQVYPNVSVIDSDGAVVASHEKGNLSCTSYDSRTPCSAMVFSVPAHTFTKGKSYVLAFASNLSGPNTSAIIGTTISFTFTTAADGEAVEANKTALNRTIGQVKADVQATKASANGSDVLNLETWVTEDQMQVMGAAIAAASGVADNVQASQDQVDEATSTLAAAWGVFQSQKQAGTKIGVSQQWNLGKDIENAATATLYTDGKLVISGTGDLKAFGRESDAPWFTSRSSIVSVSFEGMVQPTDLDFYFVACDKLTSVTGIPEGIISAERTFSQCVSLKTAPKLPDSVQNLKYTFQYCSALEFVESIPSSAEEMACTFAYCPALKTAPAIPDSVSDMSQTFWNATSLESVPNLPSSTTSYSYTFQGCSSLKSSPDIPCGTANLIGMFDGCSSLTKAPAIPEGTRMLFNAFRGCSSLTSIGAIPSTVTDATRAFANCPALTEIPADFSLPSNANTTDMFLVDTPYSAENPLETYTISDDAKLASYDWTASNRTLVKSVTWNIGKDNPSDVTAGLLENGTLTVSGAGTMRDFASASDVPWAARAGDIKKVRIDEGVASVGDYAFCNLDNASITSIKLPSGIVSIGKEAFANCKNVLAVDLTSCAGTGPGALSAIGDGAFCGIAEGATVYVREARVASLVKSLSADASDRTGGNIDRVTTALAVTNEGSISQDASFASRTLVGVLTRPEYDFVKWTTDVSTMHPATSWKALSSGTTYYAKFAKTSTITATPTAYPGYQGLDQTVQLLDLSKLPSVSAKQPDVESYGADATHFLNKITTPYKANQDIMFAFGMGRGGNANGGDGAYQKSFSLPFVSIRDESGATVARYDDGSGKLKLFGTVFDSVDGKSQGNVINAFRIGVAANELPAGTYTLHFDKGFGANNGTSFLDKDVDFVFTVEASDIYQLQYDLTGETATITGIDIDGDASAIDVFVPDFYNGKKVSSIAKDAFRGVSQVRSIMIPDTVTSIGDGAFADMDGLSFVKMAGKEDETGVTYAPVWGIGVFDNSAECLLYGWPQVASIKETAGTYANVTYCPLEDGVYVGGERLGDKVVSLTAASPTAVVSVIVGGEIVTDDYAGFVSNSHAITHAGTTRGLWQHLTACANATVTLVVRDSDGVDVAQGQIAVTGFSNNASTARVPLAPGTYQGNGSTICLTGAGAMETASYDETLDAFDNYLIDPVAAQGASFALNLGGPGSAWDATRWDWDDWTANHLNDYIWLQDASGSRIATVGDGLRWIDLRGGNGTDNTVVLGVDPGVLKVGRTYTLVAEEALTGHNVAAPLMKAVRWTFTAGTADIASATVSGIPDQVFHGDALEPAVAVAVAIPETTLWDESTETPVVTPASTRVLTQGVDFSVAYEDNNAVGVGKAVITGLNAYAGSMQTVTFAITSDQVDMSGLSGALTEAKVTAAGVASSESGNDVASGTSWATPAQIKIFNDAIAEAQAVLLDGDVTQADVDKAHADLSAAAAAFKAVLAIAQADGGALSLAIDVAESDKEATAVSETGEEVPNTQVWVNAAATHDFEKALSEARLALSNPTASQDELDVAQSALNSAQAIFGLAKQKGLKAVAATEGGRQGGDAGSKSGSSSSAVLVSTGDPVSALMMALTFGALVSAGVAVAIVRCRKRD